jgi:hypothetical protein
MSMSASSAVGFSALYLARAACAASATWRDEQSTRRSRKTLRKNANLVVPSYKKWQIRRAREIGKRTILT